VLSVFRSAIIFLQLFDRYRRDPERNTNCSEFGALGRELLDYSFDIAKERALSDGRLLPINQADGAPSRETSNNLEPRETW
jgi:hypothetical protein